MKDRQKLASVKLANGMREQVKDVRKVVKEEVMRALFANSLAETVREIVHVAIEASLIFIITHVALSIVSVLIILSVVILTGVVRLRKGKKDV